MIRSATIAALCLSLSLPAALAQQVPSTPELRLPEELDRKLRDFSEKLKPLWDETLEALRPFAEIDSLQHYEAPEVLPNGDILIRRRPDAPPLQRPAPPAEDPAPDRGPGVRT